MCQAQRSNVSRSDIQDIDKFLDGGGTLVESGAFIVGERYLDDLLDTVFAEFDRHADKEIADAVLAFEKDGTGQDLLFVLEDRLGHLDGT